MKTMPTSIQIQDTVVKNPKVSVCVMTYNQEHYIGQCLQSLVDQETDFDFEVIVCDDCSTDNTSSVVNQFATRFPNIIKAIVHKENIGAHKNFLFLHDQARGDYVAHMDGDDYALPEKLRLQADYLDKHSDCAMLFHQCLILQPDGNLVSPPRKCTIHSPCNFAEFTFRYPSSSWHSSKMYRRSANRIISSGERKFIDKHIHFLHGLSGLVGYINQDLAVYRTGVGISSNIYAIQGQALDSYKYALELGYNSKLINKIIAREHFEQGLRALNINDFSGFEENVKLGFESGHWSANSLLAYSLRHYPKLYAITRNGFRWIRNWMW